MSKPPRKGARRLSDLLRPALEPVLAKRGLSQASLILDWPVVVGARTAALCEPARLQWPPRGPRTDPSKAGPAILWLRVAPGRALDIQYQAPVIVERVNAHFGWRCISGVKFTPEPKRPVASTIRTAPPPQAAIAKAAGMTRNIPDHALRAALTRLGTGVLAEKMR